VPPAAGASPPPSVPPRGRPVGARTGGASSPPARQRPSTSPPDRGPSLSATAMHSKILRPLALALLASSAAAQVPTFQTPGMPRVNVNLGQTTQFTNDFNPAFGSVIDTFLDYQNTDEEDGEGFDLTLQSFELTANAWVDPNAWAYAVVVADEEEIELEEAAVQYVGFDSNVTLRGGRFFVDFGKQMQAHVHDLAYFDRPAVLREYLGTELAGTGLQLDNWFAVGDQTAVRYSLGVFASLAGGHGHGEEEEEDEVDAFTRDRKDLDELSFTGRITGFTDVGETGVFQLGASVRALPDFGFEFDPSGAEADDLENFVWGVDATYGFSDESGLKTWTFSGEYLIYDGDIGAELDDQGTPADPTDDTFTVVDDDVSGFYLWADHQWDQFNSAGVLYSQFEHPEEEKPEDSELTVYYTHNLSEFGRLRGGVVFNDSDEAEDSTRYVVQWTNWFGPHAHGLNW